MSTKFCKSCGKGIKDLDTHPWGTIWVDLEVITALGEY